MFNSLVSVKLKMWRRDRLWRKNKKIRIARFQSFRTSGGIIITSQRTKIRAVNLKVDGSPYLCFERMIMSEEFVFFFLKGPQVHLLNIIGVLF